MEDTILVGEKSNEILTTIPTRPVISVKIQEQDDEVQCPLALEVS
jgi:hypothetical protein